MDCIFVSTHSAVLDEKSRLVMPKVFRKDNSSDILENDFFLTPHSSGYLVIRPKTVWDEFIVSIRSATEFTPSEIRKFAKELYANSSKIKLDSQHRIVLSKELRKKLAFEDSSLRQKVKIVGRGGYFEIWPENLYRGEEESTSRLSEYLDRFDGA